jgi:exodeoxyribonuclease-5
MNADNISGNRTQADQIFNPQGLPGASGSVFMIPKTDLTPFVEEVLPLFKSVDYQNDIDFVKILAWRNVVINKYNELIRTHIFGDNLPKIMAGDKLIADAPIVEDKKIMISTNDEMEVISTTIESEVLSDLYTLKYYKARVKVFCNDIFNEYMIKIMHEDSDKDFEKILGMQKRLALSHPSGSYKAKSAWMDFYEFYNHWARVKYSYCVSVHKSQGSTYNNAYVLAWDILLSSNTLERNRILYTACTRPSHNLYVEY